MDNLREFVTALSQLFPEKGKYLTEQVNEIQTELANLKQFVKKLKEEIHVLKSEPSKVS